MLRRDRPRVGRAGRDRSGVIWSRLHAPAGSSCITFHRIASRPSGVSPVKEAAQPHWAKSSKWLPFMVLFGESPESPKPLELEVTSRKA